MFKRSRITLTTLVIPSLLLLFFSRPLTASAAALSQVISSVNTPSKIISLTFDDCADPANLQSIIDTLKANNTNATFFPVGSYADYTKDQLKAAVANGNELGNHTYTHTDLTLLTYSEIVDEINVGASAVTTATGSSLKPYLRPPFLSYNTIVQQAAGDTGYSKMITGLVDSKDWEGISSAQIVSNVLNGVSPGSIVILHAGVGAPNTPAALQGIITGLKNSGYRIVTITNLLNYVSATGVTISSSTASLKIGTNLTLSASVNPSTATNKDITWTSSNNNIVSVDNNGTLTGVSVGTATITATTADLGFTANCIVTVSPSITAIRYGGSDRFDTAVKVSQAGWSTYDNIVLANGENFADALVGVPFAYRLGAPILLTDANVLPAVTYNEITRLKAKSIFILGGTGVVSASIENDLKNRGYNVYRYSGNDRFETATVTADQVLASVSSRTAVIADAYNFPDTLSISPYAAISRYPILYTETSSLNAITKNYLLKKGITRVIIPGLYGSVSQNVETEIKNLGIEVQRIGDSDRYLTSYAITNTFKGSFGNNVMIASGENFPDALSGAALAAKMNIPVLLVNCNYIIPESSYYIRSKGVCNLYIIGGTGAISDNVPAQIMGN